MTETGAAPAEPITPTETGAAQAEPMNQKGPFAAIGAYLWYTFSGGVARQELKNIYGNLDMRHK